MTLFISMLCLLNPGEALTLKQLLTLNAKAIGCGSQQNVIVVLDIEEPSYRGQLTYQASSPSNARVDLVIDGATVFTEALDSDHAWQQMGGETPTLGNEAGRRTLQRGVTSNLYSLLKMSEMGYQMKLVDDLQVLVTDPDGFETLYFFDAKSFQIIKKQEVRAFHPDVDATEVPIDSVYSDFQLYGDCIRPAKTEHVNRDTGEVIGTIWLKSVQYPDRLDANIFKKPESVPD